MNTLELDAVSKSYGAVRAADRVTLTVSSGSRTAIVGPSGSGKTTVLRLIAGFETPDAGRIRAGSEILAHGATFVPAHRRRIGYLPQDGALFPHLTVEENIGFGLAKDDIGRSTRIAELVETVALDRSMLQRWPHELSGGQQQRVALARALAQRPRLMLLDEPFSALDAGLRAATRKATAQLLSKAGITTILVTHDQEEALSFADQIAVMRCGRLVQAGHPADLYWRPTDEATATFLGDAVILPARVANGWATCALGRIPVDDPGRTGEVRLMLRPEQIRLDGHEGCPATVVESEFSGPDCFLTLRLEGGAGASIVVRTASLTAPPVGTAIRIAVDTPSHVLSDPAKA